MSTDTLEEAQRNFPRHFSWDFFITAGTQARDAGHGLARYLSGAARALTFPSHFEHGNDPKVQLGCVKNSKLFCGARFFSSLSLSKTHILSDRFCARSGTWRARFGVGCLLTHERAPPRVFQNHSKSMCVSLSTRTSTVRFQSLIFATMGELPLPKHVSCGSLEDAPIIFARHRLTHAQTGTVVRRAQATTTPYTSSTSRDTPAS